MKALKFLAPQAVGRFSGFAWPTPVASSPGAWVEVHESLACCARGIHACRAAHLPYWIDAELWLVELGGEQLEAPTMVVARRARLLGKVEGWGGPHLREFSEFCLARARRNAEEAERTGRSKSELAAFWAADVERFVGGGRVATAAYVAAVASYVISDHSPEQAYADERALQAGWLSERLALAAL